jgi:AmpD protein
VSEPAGPGEAGATDADWLPGARRRLSPNRDARPEGERVVLAIVHSISLPPGVYGGDAVERLFTNTLDWDAHPYYAGIRGLRVSAHLFVRRDGACVQFVPLRERAWHAGASSWRGRARCNDFSVGIELEGLEGEPFADAQYASLARAVSGMRERLPLEAVAGHEHVAPGRKQDPGAGFDWHRFASTLSPGLHLPHAIGR